MKKLLQILFLVQFTLISCEKKNEKKSSNQKVVIEKPYIKEVTKIIETNSKIDTTKIRKYAESILKNEIQPSDNDETFGCFKQLFTENKNNLEFYFKVFRVIVKKSDGALSEVIATNIMDFIKFNPTFFIEHYLEFDLNEKNRFIEYIAYEFYLMEPNSEKELNEYFSTINTLIKSNKEGKYVLEIIRRLTKREMEKFINE